MATDRGAWGAVDLRGKLRERVAPFLEPDETARQVMLAQARNPWITAVAVGAGVAVGIVLLGRWDSALGPLLVGGLVGGVGVLVTKPRAIVVTDRAVLVLELKRWKALPVHMLARLPRSTRIGPVQGMQAKVEVGGDHLWIHKRFHPDVRAADADVSEPPRPDLL